LAKLGVVSIFLKDFHPEREIFIQFEDGAYFSKGLVGSTQPPTDRALWCWNKSSTWILGEKEFLGRMIS